MPAANLKEIAAAVGATFSQVRRGHDTGHIQFHLADRWACRLGVHPSVIWGDEYWQVSEAIDVHADEMLRRRQLRRQQSQPEVCV